MQKQYVIQFYKSINKLLCNLSFAGQYILPMKILIRIKHGNSYILLNDIILLQTKNQSYFDHMELLRDFYIILWISTILPALILRLLQALQYDSTPKTATIIRDIFRLKMELGDTNIFHGAGLCLLFSK